MMKLVGQSISTFIMPQLIFSSSSSIKENPSTICETVHVHSISQTTMDLMRDAGLG